MTFDEAKNVPASGPVATLVFQKKTASKPAANVPYFTPAQNPPAGTYLPPTPSDPAAATTPPPRLFTPLTIRSVTLNNRIGVAPMCMYSAYDGHVTDWHLVHLGQFALHGAGLTMVEATAVDPRGRISVDDSGIWADSHIAPLRRITDFIRSQGQASAIQLGHAGRKASTQPPWRSYGIRGAKAPFDVEDGGWPDQVLAPSAIPFDDGYAMPHEMTLQDIRELVDSFAAGAGRAVEAGFDVIEIHSAHGYVLTEFLSPLTNGQKRTDQYGGSFENRIRLLLEVIRAIRGIVPSTMPLFVRVSATEWMENKYPEEGTSWDLPSTIRLARLMYPAGVDLLHVSSGGNAADQALFVGTGYQTNLAEKIRTTLHQEGGEPAKLLLGGVGLIQDGHTARDVLEDTSGEKGGHAQQADMVFAARQFLRDPAWVRRVAEELDVSIRLPEQYFSVVKRQRK